MLVSFVLKAQLIKPFSENKKWGYKIGEKVVIIPEYDTAYPFDKTNQIALVSNKNEFNKEVNPLTGEEEDVFDYFFIDAKNNKVKLLVENFPDSMFTFGHQQELQFNYQDSSNYFKILFQNKLYLVSKKGKQISGGFDNISESKAKGYFETEKYSEFNKEIIRTKGLVDSTGLEVIKCKYHTVVINTEDSTIYCCSAVYNSKLNDDVYNYKGKLIYSNKNHIEFSSKIIHVLKHYEPNEFFVIENSMTHNSYDVDGNLFVYLKKNKALVINKDNWFILDILTKKRQKIDKDEYFQNLYRMIEY